MPCASHQTIRLHRPRTSFSVLQRLTNRLGIDTLLVALQEEFCPDHPIGSDNERARVRDAFATSLCFPVKNPVGLDGFAAGVGEQRVGDRVFRGEPAENFRGIVTNGHDLTAGRFQFLQAGLQLDQLLLAKGSPLRRPKKDQRHRPFLEQRLERDVAVRLIFESKQRRFFPTAKPVCSGAAGSAALAVWARKNPETERASGESDQFHAREDSVPSGSSQLCFWAAVDEPEGRFLRVVTLSDKLTIHNAFLDRRFRL